MKIIKKYLRAWMKAEIDSDLPNDWMYYLDDPEDGGEVIGNIVLGLDERVIDIMERTEFQDSSGKYVYEGDILRVTTHPLRSIPPYQSQDGGNPYIVSIDKLSMGGFLLGDPEGWRFENNYQEIFITGIYEEDTVEIIGNVYENSELLREKQND